MATVAGSGVFGARDQIAYEEGKAEECSTHKPSVENCRVLIVDDAEISRKMVAKLLRREGCVCDTAEGGKEAVELVQIARETGYDYDLILIDYEMPGVNGPTAVRRMREMGHTKKIVGITGHSDKAHFRAFESNGVNKVLAKPVERSRLVALLDMSVGLDWRIEE